MANAVDRTNIKYGRLTCLYISFRKKRTIYWHCKCECGNEIDVPSESLTSKNTQSCGCLHKERVHNANFDKFIDLTSLKFSRLLVTKFIGIDKKRRPIFECHCDCGKVCIKRGAALSSGNTQSCGCLRKEKVKKSATTHGLSRHDLSRRWFSMKERCYNKNHKSYKNYGGRGIKVCKQWKNNFKNFYDWSIKNGYQKELTIDRIDVNGNYCPENCRYVTFKMQSNNRRNTILIEYDNVRKPLKWWAYYFNVFEYEKFYRTLKNYNWSIEKYLDSLNQEDYII